MNSDNIDSNMPKTDTQAQQGAKYAPPAGSYPSPNIPYVPPPPKPRARRVGMVTMALALIALGVVLVLWVFIPNLDIVFIARLAPVVLVLLGAEMLIATARHKGERLRYDFLSIFVSLLLIICSLAAAIIPEVILRERYANSAANKIETELEDASYALLENKGFEVESIDWYVGVDAWYQTKTDITAEDLEINDYVQMRVVFEPDAYTSAQEFASACKAVSDEMLTLVHHIDYASFASFDENSYDTQRAEGDERYQLWLDSRWQFNATSDELEGQVYVARWLPEIGQYVSQWEYEDRLEHPEYYS